MHLSQKPFNSITTKLILISLTVFAAIQAPEICTASQETKNDVVPKLLILNDCDKDNNLRTPPYGDTVLMLNSKGQIKEYRDSLGINFVRSALSISEDGRFFIVCENSSNRLLMNETATRKELWSLSGLFASAVITENYIYAINLQNIYAIDNTGTIKKHSRHGGGTDIAVDQAHNCIWVVGADIRRYNTDLQEELKIPLTQSFYNAGAFSVDICPDGSIWVAERVAQTTNYGKNKLVNISPDGKILKSIELTFYPSCVRVNPSDGSVWITGYGKRDFSKLDDEEEWPETLSELYRLAPVTKYTQKYDTRCSLLLNIDYGGDSIELDGSDGSIWIADEDKILHYSGEGENLGEYTDFPEGRKWLAIIPSAKTYN
ncbi:MAG: hypothetical protein JW715_02465 [Sedimentisphaerales bacterium]|nr:hypothetical protein [Sedimentisphaerales bacterium]